MKDTKVTVIVDVHKKNSQLNDFLFLNPWATWMKEVDPEDVMYMHAAVLFIPELQPLLFS